MSPKVRHLRNMPQSRAISVDRLFETAFSKSEFLYRRESLFGWRPVRMDSIEPDQIEEDRPSSDPTPILTDSPDVKVRETSESFIIEVLMPDIIEESLYLEVSGDLLIIKAEKADQTRKSSDSYKQSKQRMIHRYIKLPVRAHPGNVRARLENNVIRVLVGKTVSGFSL